MLIVLSESVQHFVVFYRMAGWLSSILWLAEKQTHKE